MFWRILWRLLNASRGRLALAVLAVASGAAVCSALLNLDLDATDKLTREFRVLGANIVISAAQAATPRPPWMAPPHNRSRTCACWKSPLSRLIFIFQRKPRRAGTEPPSSWPEPGSTKQRA